MTDITAKLAAVAEKICAKLEHPTASVTYLDQDELRAALTAYTASQSTGDDALEGLRELSEALNAHEAVSDELCEGSDWMDYAGWEERLDAAKDAVIDAAVNYVRARLAAQAGER